MRRAVRLTRAFTTAAEVRRGAPPVAVLYQASVGRDDLVRPFQRPRKPGGYRDSSADIAFGLRARGFSVVTPVASPDAARHSDWCFPDTPRGIDDAFRRGARVFWSNTGAIGAFPWIETGA